MPAMQEPWALRESGLRPSLAVREGRANVSADTIQSRMPV